MRDLYTPIDTVRNIKDYGMIPALSHDWKQTREDIGSKLEDALIDGFVALTVVMAIPIIIYQTYRFARDINKRKKSCQ